MAPRRRFFRARDGLRLAALDWAGREDRTPLLCLPGLARTARDFAALAARQEGARRVVALDYAGHGESERPASASRYRLQVALRDVADAMAALHLHRVAVLGTSFGGLLAMGLGILRPAALAGVALNDIGPHLEPAGLDMVRDVIGRDPGFSGPEEAMRFLRDRLPPLDLDAAGWAGFTERTYARGEDGLLHPRWDVRIAGVLADGREVPEDLWPAFGALAHVPLLLVWGQESALLSAATVRRMRAARPDMEVVSLPGIGHAPTLAAPAAMAALDRFLARLG
ncbi:alpha/beta fold hydrolase [Crenalkalicoccus roseus]|uniref:alpha/beta fold hydrolase n=1 Tax=Crenalkalicoccus roseus TaxID=1485588 RepID=UPI0013053FF1|nr:alpha/beta fold hydrolase [Crenalkalicoccus roseus]